MTDQWYPITPTHPAPTVQVRGIVPVGHHDAHLIVSRGMLPHHNKWAQWLKGKAVPLPERVTPYLWQPQNANAWKAPLPPPAETSESGRMWSATMRFQAVEDAEASDLAREMEQDREMARNGVSYEQELKQRQEEVWWRDASIIKYEPVGSITPKMAEGRLMRAVAFCDYGRGLSIRISSFSEILSRMSKPTPSQEYATSDYIPPLRSFPQDVQDFPIAMGWFTALNPPQEGKTWHTAWEFNPAQHCVRYRTSNPPLSFAEIGSDTRIKMSAEGARQLYLRTMKTITKFANGVIVSPALAHLEALRERNLAAKRVA